jgi:hypothetical protein
MSGGADVVTLSRAHLARFAERAGLRVGDRPGAPWDVAVETARLLGIAAREVQELRAQVRRLEAANAALTAAIEAHRRKPRPAEPAALELVLVDRGVTSRVTLAPED